MSQNLPSWPLAFATNVVEAVPRKRILVVDDEPAIRRLICGLFADEGYLVSHAGDGADALQQLRSIQFDVVLDLCMPVMNGLEFARASRLVDGCAKLPIILLICEVTPVQGGDLDGVGRSPVAAPSIEDCRRR